MAQWKRLPEASDLWIDNATLQRTYGMDGEQYPRVNISLWDKFTGRDGVRICVTKCSSEDDDRWYDCNLPDELIGELVEMLQELGAQKAREGKHDDAK